MATLAFGIPNIIEPGALLIEQTLDRSGTGNFSFMGGTPSNLKGGGAITMSIVDSADTIVKTVRTHTNSNCFIDFEAIDGATVISASGPGFVVMKAGIADFATGKLVVQYFGNSGEGNFSTLLRQGSIITSRPDIKKFLVIGNSRATLEVPFTVT